MNSVPGPIGKVMDNERTDVRLLIILAGLACLFSSHVTAGSVVVSTSAAGFSYSDLSATKSDKIESGRVELNPSLVPMFSGGIANTTSITSSYGDTSNGKLGALASIGAPTDYTLTTESPLASANTTMVTDMTFSGFSGSMTVEAELDVHGYQTMDYGVPSLTLSSSLLVAPPLGVVGDRHSYGSSLIFDRNPEYGYSTATVFHKPLELIISPTGDIIFESDVYSGASFAVSTNTADEVQGTVSLAFDVTDGLVLQLTTFLQASAANTGEFAGDGSINMFASSGETDALSTGTLRLLVPYGVNVTGDPILDHIVTPVSAVPLPAAGWLFISAFGLIGYLGTRKQNAQRKGE